MKISPGKLVGCVIGTKIDNDLICNVSKDKKKIIGSSKFG